MKIIIGCTVALVLVPIVKAQGPCFTYSDNYATYTSVSMSSDGGTIYASTEVSGTGSMTFENNCSGINYGTIHHTPTAVALILWNNGQNSAGGSVVGQWECPDCQIDITSTASTPLISGNTYTFSYVGQVNCNYAGNILETSGTLFLSFGAEWTTYENAGAPVGCAYTMACQPGDTPACPQEGYLYGLPDPNTHQCDSPGIETNGHWISTDGGTTKFCFGDVSQAIKVPGPCGYTTTF